MGVETLLVGAAVGGGVLGAASSVAQGVQADRAARFNADELERDATFAIRQSKFNARQERIAGREIISTGTAITGASGVKVNRGSALRVREVNQGRLETSITNILFSGRVAAHRLKNQAAQLRAQGKAAKTAGIIGGVTSILGGATQAGTISSNFAISDKLTRAKTFSSLPIV